MRTILHTVSQVHFDQLVNDQVPIHLTYVESHKMLADRCLFFIVLLIKIFSILSLYLYVDLFPKRDVCRNQGPKEFRG